MNENFTWVSWPVKESAAKNIVAIGGILIMIAGGFIWLGLWGILLGILVAMLTLHSYFLPTEYSIDSEGISVSYFGQHRKYMWPRFKSYYKDNNGILLSPFPTPTRLENFRGLYVRYGMHRDKVTALIDAVFEERDKKPEISE